MSRHASFPPTGHTRSLPPCHKTRGDIAEALLIAIASALGFMISRPFSENCRYDYILDWHGRLFRVQLKSAWTRGRRGLYQINFTCGKPKLAYSCRDIDFFIAYIAEGPDVVPGALARKGGAKRRRAETSKPRNFETWGSWYIIPAAKLVGRHGMEISANPSRTWLLPFRDAWHLLRP
jgi:hypothetical protein